MTDKAPTRFKPIALNLDEHAKLAIIAERMTKEAGHPVTIPKVVITLVNRFGDQL